MTIVNQAAADAATAAFLFAIAVIFCHLEKAEDEWMLIVFKAVLKLLTRGE